MAADRTAVTEIVTGLGASGLGSLEEVLASDPPPFLVGVGEAQWSLLRAARTDPKFRTVMGVAWANGRAFFEGDDGLRRRRPHRIEWKGPHKPPGYESLPADLRIDHVYLVSCKYGSDISTNCSPSNLFERLLSDRSAGSEPWYQQVAPAAYERFYEELRAVLGTDLPHKSSQLGPDDLRFIRSACERRWPTALVEPWRRFSFEVAAASAARWRTRLDTAPKRELQLWRLLRLETSPYFVLGTSRSGIVLRYRVATPWDWRQSFKLRGFTVEDVDAGQPLVRWTADVEGRDGASRVVTGDVEVRWSHGRFSAVEAKLHLKTAPAAVPGYYPLDET